LEDLSELIAGLQVSFENLAYLQMQKRLRAYVAAVGEREGRVYKSWQLLPKKYLDDLLAKIKQEIKDV